MLKIENLNFNFNSEVIFKDLSIEFASNKISIILGESGSGKSTILKILADLIPEAKIKFALPDLSFVFQEPVLIPWMNVRENVLLAQTLSQKLNSSLNVDFLLKEVGLFESQNKKPFELSGGMKMRTSIARSLMTNPKYLFMDEPFSALDELTRNDIQDLLLKLQADYKMTILFVTHSLSEAIYLGHEIFYINKQQKNIQKLMDLKQIKNSNFRKSTEFQKLYSDLEECILK